MSVNAFYRFFYKQNTATIILFGVSLPLIMNVFLTLLKKIIGYNDVPLNVTITISVKDFFLVMFFSPFIETIVFQYAPLRFAGFFTKDKINIIPYTILFSSLIFGLSHFMSALYISITFIYGLVWSSCCFLFLRKNKSPIVYTSLIHALYNGLLFCSQAFGESGNL